MVTAAKPWEQMDGEPDAAYVRFQCYLNLGPCRTLYAAFEAFGGDAKNGQKRPTSGTWTKYYSRFRWAKRAAAWDVHNFQECGRIATLRFMRAVEKMASKWESGWDRIDPTTIQELLEIGRELRSLIPPDTVSALMREKTTLDDEE